MKKITIPYMRGLAAYCDFEDIKWKKLDNDRMEIYYDNEADLFITAFYFGREYDHFKDK